VSVPTSLLEGASWDLITGCRYGTFLIPKHDRYVGDALRTYGEFSQLELDRLLPLARGQRVLEVGANLGALTIPLAQVAAEVIAVEPQRWVAQVLAANVVLNQCRNVRTYWLAGGAIAGCLTVPYLNPAGEASFGSYQLKDGPLFPSGYLADTVEQRRLDTLPDLDQVGLIKIDVEGMELEVMQGLAQTIDRWSPVIWFEAELLDWEAAGAWLQARGYALYPQETMIFNPANWAGLTLNRWPNTRTLNMLAVPRSLHPPEAASS
jgi:FkbM family methyltransferase